MTLIRMPDSKSAIRTAISPILVWNDGKNPRVVGTAILLGPGLALSALHVIEDFVPRTKHTSEIKANVVVFQTISGAAWYIRRVWATTHTDAVFLGLEPKNDAANNFKWHRFGINLHLPKPGDKIFAAGFSSSQINGVDEGLTQEGITVIKTSLHLQILNGVVQESHGSKHEGHLDFPCFQCNAKFDHQMSGGPVLDERGYLRGLVCKGFTFSPDDTGEPVSFAAGIMSAMAIKIDRTLPSLDKTKEYYILELVKNGFLPVIGYEKVKITVIGNKRTRIELK
jgi:hypothetical protein